MNRSTIQNILFLLGISGLFFSGACSGSATVTNAGFETFIANTDSFPGWSFKKDSLGGTRYTITQETDSAHSGTGAVKIKLLSSTDTSFGSAGVTGTITGLPVKKIFTLTAWVKYINTPDAYKNAQIAVSQATTLSAAPYYIFRKWSTLWENSTVNSNGWTQLTVSDTSVDSANYFNIIITLWKSGTFWVDDIAITYTDIPQSVNYAIMPIKQGIIRNNRITFSHQMPYSFEACSVDGKAILRRSGMASALVLNSFNLQNGVYLVRVKTPERTYSSKVVVSR
jgi:hypothetical protein